MVFDGVLVEGREIRLGAFTYIVDDSAWLQEAPLDVDALPVTSHTYNPVDRLRAPRRRAITSSEKGLNS